MTITAMSHESWLIQMFSFEIWRRLRLSGRESEVWTACNTGLMNIMQLMSVVESLGITCTQKDLDRSSFSLSHSLIKYCDSRIRVPKLYFTTYTNFEFRQEFNFKTHHRLIWDETRIFDDLPVWDLRLDLQLFSSTSTRWVRDAENDWNCSWSHSKRSHWL